MSEIVDKIAERYADEITGLPSLGTLTSFLIVATGCYMIEKDQLAWLPQVSEIFGNNLSKIFDGEHGIITETSLGALLLAAGSTFFLKYIYSKMLKRIFATIAKTKIISKYVSMASASAQSAGIENGVLIDNCTTFLSDELTTQRKIFQRIHGAAFIVFTVAILSICTIIKINSLIIFFCCVIGLTWLEYIAIRHYLVRLFPALCVVWATKGKLASFGEE